MASAYPFKRAFYYSLADKIKNNKVVVVCGPRKIGKTIALLQIRDEFSNAKYTDIKSLSSDTDRAIKIKKVIDDIEQNRDVIHLIDETTYLLHPDASISQIALAFTENPNSKTKVVLTGSQSKALKSWAFSAFGSKVSFIETDFLSYSEWLALNNYIEPSENSYNDFVLNTKSFYDYSDAATYLESCLEETINSNSKALNNIINNDCDLLNTEKLLDVMYSSMITLHNRVKYDTFIKKSLFEETIKREYVEQYLQIGEEAVKDRIAAFLSDRYTKYRLMDTEELHQALQFLSNCGLITITYVGDNFNIKPYIIKDYLECSKDNISKKELFEDINICIKYPMFYAEMLKDVLGDQMPDRLTRSMLGSIVECHTRGLLPMDGCFEYHDHKDREIDYVNISKGLAIEFSISNKDIKDTHFDVLPDGYKKILLTKNIMDRINGIERIPYYEFIYEYSTGKNLVEALKSTKKDEPDGPYLPIIEETRK